MERRTLGPLSVSRLALGAMQMGGRTTPADAERLLDRFRAACDASLRPLAGRFRRGEPAPAGSRIAEAEPGYEEAYERRAVEQNFRVADAAQAIAASHGTTDPAVAIAWLLSVEGVTAPIIGPRTTEQLEELLEATTVQLTAEGSARLEQAPPPAIYPQRMLHHQVGIRSMPPLRRP